LLAEDRSVHDWYRFVLSFPPHLVRTYLERFGLNKDNTVLDPFCGTGTTLVECKKLGINCIGIEALPMAYFASRVKLNWGAKPEALQQHASKIAIETEQELAYYKRNGRSNKTSIEASRTLESLPPEKTTLLIKDSISPIPLHKTLILLSVIERLKNDLFYDYERLALAKSLVTSTGNLRFGPEVGIGSIKSDADVVGVWLNEMGAMTADLADFGGINGAQSSVYCADARDLDRILKPESVDVVFTSPPYPNEKDYTRTTRLESVILGFIADKSDLRNLKQTLLRSNTRNVYKQDDDDKWVNNCEEIREISEMIERKRVDLGKTSGFEKLYSRVTMLYFGGMYKHLFQLRPALKSGARLAYVVGDQASYLQVMIRTGHILAQIAQSLGYELESIDLFRSRFATATKQDLREEVVVLRWPGK